MKDSFFTEPTKPHLTKEKQPIPDFIGPYKVEALLSKGGMSWLYLGIDPQTKKLVAIKTLPTSHIKNPEIIERFSKEAKVIALTNHPNIVKLYGEGTWEKGFYIAMEWIHGISLRQFLVERSFSLKRSLEILLQVSFALEHLHSHGVIHRDLKPENILIEESGAIKVIDFGIAQAIEDKPSDSLVGTPSYMSPEQKEDPSHVTFASDIYSLGVIAYELITGAPSFGVIQISSLPKELGKIIEKALAISVSLRYQSILEFIHDLSTYLASESFDKEKPERDQVKEMLEIFEKTSQAISPFPAPLWDPADIGIAKTLSSSHFGLYYDLFKISPDHYFLFMASPSKQGLDPLFAATTLRGMVKAFMLKQNEDTFKPSQLIEFLTQETQLDPLIRDFALSYLYLNSASNQLSFFGAGLSSLIHTRSGGAPRILHNKHSLLSDETLSEFSETLDNWTLGDTLIYHSLIPDPFLLEERKAHMETELSKIAEDSALLSAQPQAEQILKAIKSHSLFSTFKETQVVIAIQRIS